MRAHEIILLVDDDPVDREAVVRAFRANRVTNPISEVGDGVEALQFLRREGPFGEANRPSLILMDLNMPRLSGLECLYELKDDPDLCHIPVVILTASREEVDVVNSYRGGAASYIMKPVVFQALLESIRTFDLYWTLSELPS